MKSPLNYLGGKSRLADKIVSLIPEHHCYCEPFCGAAWVFFYKEPSKVEIINDLDGELVTFWRVIQNHLEEFLRYYRFAIVSRAIFELEQKKSPETLTDIQRAVRYYYLQKLSFGGKTHKRTFGTGPSSASCLNLSNIEERLLEVHWRLERVAIENLTAWDCIVRYDRPDTFFYIDPPYWNVADYAVPFTNDDYSRLADVLSDIDGSFIMSINDTPEIRKQFKGFRKKKAHTWYSTSNGRGTSHGRSQVRTELLIHNLRP